MPKDEITVTLNMFEATIAANALRKHGFKHLEKAIEMEWQSEADRGQLCFALANRITKAQNDHMLEINKARSS